MKFEETITVSGKCPACGKPIKFEAFLMKAYKDRGGIGYASDLRDGQEEVSPERGMYWYDYDCPACGYNMEGVLGEASQE